MLESHMFPAKDEDIRACVVLPIYWKTSFTYPHVSDMFPLFFIVIFKKHSHTNIR